MDVGTLNLDFDFGPQAADHVDWDAYLDQFGPLLTSGVDEGIQCISPTALSAKEQMISTGQPSHLACGTYDAQPFAATQQDLSLLERRTRNRQDSGVDLPLQLDCSIMSSGSIDSTSQTASTSSAGKCADCQSAKTSTSVNEEAENSTAPKKRRTYRKRSSPKDSEDYLRERREKNRVAATKSRLKKSNAIGKMEAQAQEMCAHQSRLQELVFALRQEALELREMIIRDSNCRCPIIRQYLDNQVEGFLSNSTRPGIVGSSPSDALSLNADFTIS